MKTVETISTAENFVAANLGKLSELCQYVFPLSLGVEIPGRVMLGSVLRCSGAEVSFTVTPAGSGGDFLHTHKTHEELYLVLSGEGEFQVDGKYFAISEGCVVRVAPNGKRAFRNTGNVPMTMICIQSKKDSLTNFEFADANILEEKIEW